MNINTEMSKAEEQVEASESSGVGYREFLDLHYLNNPEHERQRIDLYLPMGKGPFPLALWIHGGGWQSCDRRVGQVADRITGKGVALASVGYRLITDGFPFPAQIHDCMEGLSWLELHADTYGLDMDRVGVFGHSAGGHLSSLLMLVSQGKAHFPGPSVPRVRIVAGAFWSAVLDLSRRRGKWPEDSSKWNDDSVFCRFFFPEGGYDEAFALWASPASYLAGAGRSSMLIVHGDQDDLVPFEQASAFADAARAAGGNIVFRREAGKGHNMPPDIWGDSIRFFQTAFEQDNSILRVG